LPLSDISNEASQQDVNAVLQKKLIDNLFIQGKHIVVVEDDMLVAQAMAAFLEGMGGEVRCFHSAEDALRHANIEHADYFIADYMLGGTLNGIQFLNLIHQRRGKPINRRHLGCLHP
jgi:CheY-like chemotaxis protein